MIVIIYFYHSEYLIYIAGIFGSQIMYQDNVFFIALFSLFALMHWCRYFITCSSTLRFTNINLQVTEIIKKLFQLLYVHEMKLRILATSYQQYWSRIILIMKSLS